MALSDLRDKCTARSVSLDNKAWYLSIVSHNGTTSLGIPDMMRSAYDDALSLGVAYNYLDDTTKRSNFERDTVALSMTFPFDFFIRTEEETTTTTTTTTTTALTVVDCAKTWQQAKAPRCCA
jgi:hypothetical protein